jgi:hypothetical protein
MEVPVRVRSEAKRPGLLIGRNIAMPLIEGQCIMRERPGIHNAATQKRRNR